MPRGLKLVLVVAVVALAGCSSQSTPEVTFSAHGTSVTVPAARYCDPTGAHCTPPPKNPVAYLVLPGRTPLEISVPQQVSDAPWQVAFVYRTAHGESLQGRTPVFPPKQRNSYALELPPDGAQFEHIEVQEYSAVMSPATGGGVNFSIGGSWLLDIR